MFQLDIATKQSFKDEQEFFDVKKAEKQTNEDVRNIMTSLFYCLEEEFLSFLNIVEKQDPL